MSRGIEYCIQTTAWTYMWSAQVMRSLFTSGAKKKTSRWTLKLCFNSTFNFCWLLVKKNLNSDLKLGFYTMQSVFILKTYGSTPLFTDRAWQPVGMSFTVKSMGCRFTMWWETVFSHLSSCLTVTNIFRSITLTLLHSERPKLYTILAFLSAIGLKKRLKGFFNEILYKHYKTRHRA